MRKFRQIFASFSPFFYSFAADKRKTVAFEILSTRTFVH